MRSSASILIFACLLMGRVAPAQDAAPEAAPAGGGQATEVSFTILREPDGEYVALNDFLDVLRKADPNAHSNWQNVLGVLRLSVGGHEFQIFEKRPVLIMDNSQRVMPRALRVKRSAILIPLESVNTVFRAVGVEIQGVTPSALAPEAGSAPEATPSGGVPGGATPTPSAAMPGQSGSLFGGAANPTPLPPIESPPQLENATPLTWKELKDSRHQTAPRKITLVADSDLARLSERLKTMLDSGLSVQTSIVEAKSRRSSSAIVERVRSTQPELVVDLMLGPADGADAISRGSLEVWSVHEALWPADTNQLQEPINNFRPHQFHNLALGSMLRSELSRSFPAYEIRFELAPSFLLRRIDAPSVAVVIPPSVFGRGQEVDYIARTIAGGIINYFQGVQMAR